MDSSPAVLKERAAALELRKQPEKALVVYSELLAAYSGTEHVDAAVRNRVGDLHLRLKQVDEAVAQFELSADGYAHDGFMSNAIALCNKILRHLPDHVPTLRRLARFSAEKGMLVEAQRHYLSVAEALEKLGEHGEALRALDEFTRLSPDDAHVRAVVVGHLIRTGRPQDALPHLTVLHRLHLAAAREDDAAGVAQVALQIDANWVAQSQGRAKESLADLPFLALDGDFDDSVLELSAARDSATGSVPGGSAASGARESERRDRSDRRGGGDRRKSPRR